MDEYKCRTKRYENSSLPYLARLLKKQWWMDRSLKHYCNVTWWTMGTKSSLWFWSVLNHKFAELCFLPLVTMSAIYIWQYVVRSLNFPKIVVNDIALHLTLFRLSESKAFYYFLKTGVIKYADLFNIAFIRSATTSSKWGKFQK